MPKVVEQVGRYGLGALSILYIIFPNAGLIELVPDAIPVVGHLDEAAFTFVAAWALRLLPNLSPTALSIVVSSVLGLVGAVYLVYPSFGFIELIPDVIPFIGNLDEAGASLLVANALKQYATLFGLVSPATPLPSGATSPETTTVTPGTTGAVPIRATNRGLIVLGIVMIALVVLCLGTLAIAGNTIAALFAR